MIRMKANTALPAPTDARIAAFQDYCHIELPPDYVAFLKQGNGGVPEASVFVQGNRERVVERFLCLLDKQDVKERPEGAYDLSVVLSQLDERLIDNDDTIGFAIIPVAALFAGDFVCLDFRRDARNPTVAVWDHELSEPLNPHLETVASSFTAFLTSMRT